jgi:hypothetical protein
MKGNDNWGDFKIDIKFFIFMVGLFILTIFILEKFFK